MGAASSARASGNLAVGAGPAHAGADEHPQADYPEQVLPGADAGDGGHDERCRKQHGHAESAGEILDLHASGIAFLAIIREQTGSRTAGV